MTLHLFLFLTFEKIKLIKILARPESCVDRLVHDGSQKLWLNAEEDEQIWVSSICHAMLLCVTFAMQINKGFASLFRL